MLGEIALIASIGLMAWGLTGNWRSQRNAAKRQPVYQVDDEPDLLPVEQPKKTIPELPEPSVAPSSTGVQNAAMRPYADDRELETTLKWQIEYEDAFENVTKRVIEIQGIQVRDATIYVNAWCHKRHDNRLFRLDRITHFTSVTTGEIHTDKLWFVSKISGFDFIALARENSDFK